MELKVNKEEICASETALKTKQEQALELDYVLPDYYPEIFKILKCFTVPRISSYNVSGSTLSYEITVNIRVLYCSENSTDIQTIEQKLVFTKSADLDKICENPEINIVPSVDYINCRAVNQRRIDIRGAVSSIICVTDMCRSEVISDAFGMDIQLRKIPVTYPVNRLFASKKISVNEEFELGISKPEINSVIYCGASVASTDKKVIANKMVAKGEVLVNIFYTCSDGKVESMQFSLPFSQIVDIEGIDERFDCHVDADILACEVNPRSDGDGKTKIAECSLEIMIKCSACRMITAELAVDEFSSKYETSDSRAEVKIDRMPQWINTNAIAKASVKSSGDAIDCVYGVQTDVKNCSFTADTESGGIIASGTALYTMIACSEEGKVVFIDKEEPFTFNIPAENITPDCIFNLKAVPVSCSYNITSDGTADIKAEFKISGSICCSEVITGLTDISADETAEIAHNKDCALKLYFAEPGENVWDIAKHYHASAQAVLDENDLESENVSDNCMLIIPIM